MGIGALSVIAAPFDGIGTYTQGLVMNETITDEERITIYEELSQWIFDQKIGCMLQVDDWQLLPQLGCCTRVYKCINSNQEIHRKH